jgi:BASS family bile acid:Na+ symporter
VSPFLTPYIASVFAHKYVSVSFYPLFHQMIMIVLLPLVAGIGARSVLGARRTTAIKPFLPMGSAILLYCLTFGLVAAAAPAISRNLLWIPIIALTTSVLCILNLAIGYVLARMLRLDEANARAVMFDAGIYNSGLGAVLATVNFGPFAAVPPLMNTLMNMIIGSTLATYLHEKPVSPNTLIIKPITIEPASS